jgi:putative oxidoreductase
VNRGARRADRARSRHPVITRTGARLVTDTPRRAWTQSFLPGATHSLLRVITGALFMQHGVQKLFGLLLAPDRPWNGAPEVLSQMWFAGVLEVFGGALIVLGLFTRPVAFLLAGEMAVAYFQAHAPRAFFPVLNGGEHTVLFCFVFLHLFGAGAGPFSLDAAWRARRERGTPGRAPEGAATGAAA